MIGTSAPDAESGVMSDSGTRACVPDFRPPREALTTRNVDRGALGGSIGPSALVVGECLLYDPIAPCSCVY